MESARDIAITPNLHVVDRKGLSSIRPAQVQAQSRYRSIKSVNDMQGLHLNRRFKVVKELRNTGERWAWHKRAPEQILFLPFNLHLANLPLPSVHEINDVSNMLWHS